MMIGVLALQGGFAEHIRMLRVLKAQCREIRQPCDLEGIDGLIIPGGESTVITKLLHEDGLFEPLNRLISGGLPVFGTCAGMIVLSKGSSCNGYRYFDAIDIAVKRNAFGRQLGSFHAAEDFASLGRVPMTFIRAPIIEKAGGGVTLLACAAGRQVAARQGNILVTAFHPELEVCTKVHSYFLQICSGN